MTHQDIQEIIKTITKEPASVRFVVVCTDESVETIGADFTIPLVVGQLHSVIHSLSSEEPEWMNEAVDRGLKQAVADGPPAGH